MKILFHDSLFLFLSSNNVSLVILMSCCILKIVKWMIMWFKIKLKQLMENIYLRRLFKKFSYEKNFCKRSSLENEYFAWTDVEKILWIQDGLPWSSRPSVPRNASRGTTENGREGCLLPSSRWYAKGSIQIGKELRPAGGQLCVQFLAVVILLIHLFSISTPLVDIHVFDFWLYILLEGVDVQSSTWKLSKTKSVHASECMYVWVCVLTEKRHPLVMKDSFLCTFTISRTRWTGSIKPLRACVRRMPMRFDSQL